MLVRLLVCRCGCRRMIRQQLLQHVLPVLLLLVQEAILVGGMVQRRRVDPGRSGVQIALQWLMHIPVRQRTWEGRRRRLLLVLVVLLLLLGCPLCVHG